MLNRSGPSPSTPFASRSSSTSEDDDILAALTKISVSTPPEDASNVSLSGESFPISAGGVSGVDNTVCPTKLVKVILITPEVLKLRCCGFIGTRKNSFCFKLKNSCSSHKNKGTHFSSKFSPKLESFYIYRSNACDSAWCEFNISSEIVLKFPDKRFNIDSRQTLEDWKILFSSMNSDLKASEIDKAIEFMKNPPNYDSLKTPSKFKQLDFDLLKEENEFIIMEKKSEVDAALLFLTEKEKKELRASNVPEDLISHITDIGNIVRTVFNDLQTVRSDLVKRAMLTDVSPDLMKISSSLTGLKTVIGNNSEGTYPDLWTGLSEIKDSIENLSLQVTNLKHSHESQTAQITSINDIISGYGKRWNALGKNWIPLLVKHEKLITNLTNLVNNSGTDTDAILNTNVSSIPHVNSNHTGNHDHNSSKIQELENRLQVMEARVATLAQTESTGPDDRPRAPFDREGYGSLGVTYKQYYFADENAVKTWMKDNMSTPSHGLFVDIVSFSEFFGGDIYVERNKTLNDLYISNKIGYATMADSIVAASFQNILPGSYGRNTSPLKTSSDTDLQAQPELPGLASFKKWDNHDGATGRKYWIKKECRNTGIQIDGMIRAQLDKTAQYLAKELLIDSMAMSEELFNFISTSYEDTMHSGRFDTHQAWALTSKFVKRIFTEIGDARIIARDGVHVSDPWTTAAKFLFATLRAHEVMSGFMRLNIKDHPSISSEMVKFICYSQPATDTAEVLSRLSSNESSIRTNQSNISKLETKARKIDVWKVELDKLIKKLKEHAGLSS
jgi:hypothetical protein